MNTGELSYPYFIEVEAMVNTHSHERKGDNIVRALIEKSSIGGVDVLGPQPNTSKELTNAEEVTAYIETAKILAPQRVTMHFIPFVMLTESTTEKNIAECVEAKIVDGKAYPFMRTTKSDKGIKQWGSMLSVFKWCGKHRMNVHGHFEHPNMCYSDRDAEFMCLPLVEMFLDQTEARIFWEHGTDGRCIPYWKKFAQSGRFFLTLTAHHLATNEDQARRDIRSECKPTIKTEPDRVGLVQLVSEDHFWVMAGADDAPHPDTAKHVHEGQCACGAYTAPFLIQLYAHALDCMCITKKGIETFIHFVSRNARNIHNLPPASRKVKLVRKPFVIPNYYRIGSWKVEPFWAGRTLNWSIAP